MDSFCRVCHSEGILNVSFDKALFDLKTSNSDSSEVQRDRISLSCSSKIDISWACALVWFSRIDVNSAFLSRRDEISEDNLSRSRSEFSLNDAKDVAVSLRVARSVFTSSVWF